MASDAYARIIRAVRSPSYDRTKVGFRVLMGACVKNTIADVLRKRGRRPDEVPLDSQPELEADAEWEEDYRENIMIQGLKAVQDRVEEDTWLVFVALKEGKSSEDIANTFGRDKQWVYNAKKRIMKMLREECHKLDADPEIHIP
jgi:DNA-directed RNA polymerase specialized sigma24 family protein